MNGGPEVKLSVCLRERGIQFVRLGENIRREKKGVFLIKSCWEWFAPGKLSYVRIETAGSHSCDNTGSSVQLPHCPPPCPVSAMDWFFLLLEMAPRSCPSYLPVCGILERAYPLEPGYITRNLFHSFSMRNWSAHSGQLKNY